MTQASTRPLAALARRTLLALALAGLTVQAAPVLATEPARPPLSRIELGGSILPHGIVGAEGVEPTVWFSAARRSAIGEIDVATRSVGYIALGHGARPRALARCPNGKLYALDPALNVIHEITSATEEVVRHTMPDGHTADLSGVQCTAGNLVVFTGYNGWVGTLDVASGKVSLAEAVTGRGPSSIALSAGGAVWFAAYASNQIVRVDPVSMRQDAFAMPAGVEGPKGMVVDSTGRVWVTAYRSGRGRAAIRPDARFRRRDHRH
jgi:virginiamycin B lyase